MGESDSRDRLYEGKDRKSSTSKKIKPIRISVDLTKKLLDIEGKKLKLEDALLNAFVDNIQNAEGEKALNLEYPAMPEDESYAQKEMDKIYERYGERLLERIMVCSTLDKNRHYVSLVGYIEPKITTGENRRLCYDILQPLESRERKVR